METGEGTSAPFLVIPEFVKEYPEEHRIAELVAISPETIEAQRPALWALVDMVMKTAVSSHDQQTTYLTGKLLDWQLFAQPGDALPEGLEVIEHSNGGPKITYDTRTWYNANCAKATLNKMRQLDFDVVLDVVKAELDSKKSETLGLVTTLLRRNPAHHLLQSFDVETPVLVEKPLSPYMQAVYEGQVRGSWQESGPFDPRSTEDLLQRKDLWRVGNKTEISTEHQSHDIARQRAKEYFASYLADAIITIDTKYKSTPKAEVIAELLDPATDYAPCSYWAACKVNEDLTNSPITYLSHSLATQLIETFMDNLFSTNYANTKYDELLKASLLETATTMTGFILESPGYVEDYHDDHGPTLREYFIAPRTERIPQDQLPEMDEHQHVEWSGFMTMEESAKLSNKKIGRLAWGDIPRPLLLQTKAKVTGLPTRSNEQEIVLSLFSQEFEYADPDLIGYRLVSRNGQNYGFAPAETDLYAPALVSVPSEKAAELVALYQSIGLTELAAQLEATPQLTVHDVETSLQQYSSYLIPSKVDLNNNPDTFPSKFRAKEFSDFAYFVQDNKLQSQCSISYELLRLSLEQIFGKGCVSPVDGYVVNSQERNITALGHVQAAFSHEGLAYILDSSPAAPISYDASLLAQPKRPPATAAISDFGVPKIERSSWTLSVNPTELQEYKIKSVRQALEVQLCAVFDKRDAEQLYTTTNRLPPHSDPISRTVEVVLHASYGEVDSAKILALADYLRAYQNTSETERRQMSVQSYNPHLVEVLESAIDSLMRTLRTPS